MPSERRSYVSVQRSQRVIVGYVAIAISTIVATALTFSIFGSETAIIVLIAGSIAETLYAVAAFVLPKLKTPRAK